MDINWSKTFFMIITNQRFKHPSTIEVLNINIEVVKTFKLLGVLIDDKLNFSEFVHQIKKDIYKNYLVSKKYFIYLNQSKFNFSNHF